MGVVFFTIVLSILKIALILRPKNHFYLILFLFILAGIVAYAQSLSLTRAENFDLGDVGERIIEDEINKLPPSFVVLKNLVAVEGHGNIDFAVIGQNGIATLEAKSHSGRIKIQNGIIYRNGWRTNFAWQANSQARDIEKILRQEFNTLFTVRPFVVFSSDRSSVRHLKGSSKTVTIAHVSVINRYLQEPLGTPLTFEQIERIQHVLKKFEEA